MTETCDAVVIGAGCAGASIAFHLAERGLKVTLLEREVVASGATGRSSGLVRMHYDLEAESRLAWASFAYFRNWRERVGGESGFTRTGFLQIESRARESLLRGNVAMHQRIGIPSLVVGAEDVKRLAPSFVTDDFDFAAYEPESGYADPVLTTNSFTAAARERGTRLVQECEVTGIRLASGRVAGAATTKGDFSAPVVVNAAGTRAASIGKMVGLNIPLTTWTHDVMHIRRPREIGFHPTVIDGALSFYFRPDTGNLTLVALEDNNRLGEPPDAPTKRVAADFVERAVERICRRIPGMDAGSLQSTHVGRDALTPDQRAILGQAGPEGFYLACGFSGTGFKISPAVGACMSELIMDGKASTVDISPFTLARFARGEHLKGEHDYGDIWH
ncbi:MAG: FAD-binding oxidoreductase [Chloroflexota bacterium]